MKKTLITLGIVSIFLGGCTLYNQPAQNTNTVNNTSTTNVQPLNNKLDLSNKKLTKLPSYVLDLTNLVELNISGNEITGALPAEIRRLQNLQVLNASNNLMSGVPAEIGQLKNLRILNLANNQLTGLPNELANLKNLTTFNLSGNNYSQTDLDTIIKGLPSSVQIITIVDDTR